MIKGVCSCGEEHCFDQIFHLFYTQVLVKHTLHNYFVRYVRYTVRYRLRFSTLEVRIHIKNLMHIKKVHTFFLSSHQWLLLVFCPPGLPSTSGVYVHLSRGRYAGNQRPVGILLLFYQVGSHLPAFLQTQ